MVLARGLFKLNILGRSDMIMKWWEFKKNMTEWKKKTLKEIEVELELDASVLEEDKTSENDSLCLVECLDGWFFATVDKFIFLLNL